MHGIPKSSVLRSKAYQGLGVDDYYVPPVAGQSFTQYESFMKMPIYTASAVVIGALIAGPIGAIAGGIGSWLLNADGAGHSSKPKVQGG